MAFFFGQHLNEALNVPVGLIGSYWGGTAVEPWIDEFTFSHEKELFELSQKQQVAGWSPTANSSIYNAMIHPIKNYTIAGVIWYQGEANNERAADYGSLFDGMIRGWRNEFHRFCPFILCRLLHGMDMQTEMLLIYGNSRQMLLQHYITPEWS